MRTAQANLGRHFTHMHYASFLRTRLKSFADSIPWSNTIQNHAMSWNRSLMISKLHWNIFIAATIIGLIISGFAVYVTVRFLKRKGNSFLYYFYLHFLA